MIRHVPVMLYLPDARKHQISKRKCRPLYAGETAATRGCHTSWSCCVKQLVPSALHSIDAKEAKRVRRRETKAFRRCGVSAYNAGVRIKNRGNE